jgi:hypothetical protein
MANILEIIDAWKSSFERNPDKVELAEKRLSICNGCEFKKEIIKGKDWSMLCKACGCPIKKKIFSKQFNACEKGYWTDTDSEHFPNFKEKKDVSII